MPINVGGVETNVTRSQIEGGLASDQWAVVTISVADAGSQTIVAAPSSGSQLLITHMLWYATSSNATFFQILDGAAGTARLQTRTFISSNALLTYLPNINVLLSDAKAFVIKNVTGGGTTLDMVLSHRTVTVIA